MKDWQILLFLAGLVIGGTVVYYFMRPVSATYRAVDSNEAVVSSATKPTMTNLETWEWTDWKGRKRTITVHREVKQYV